MTGTDKTRHGLALPRSYRLCHPADYRRVFDQARRLGSRGFTLLVCPNGLDHARLGMAISRRSLPKAVARNRVKRLLRETFRHACSELPANDLVFLSRPALAGLDREAVRAEIERLLSQVQEATAGRRTKSDRRAAGGGN